MISISQEYETPDNIFEPLNQEFDFKCDLAASVLNHKCPEYYTIETDGFLRDWYGINWINPPFKTVGKWVKKAYEDSIKYNSTIVMIILVKANTNWWRDCVMKSKEVRFINQKVQFKDTPQGLRFPACIVVFSPHKEDTKFSVMNQVTNRGKCNEG